ncbi:MAG: hypothetical protein HY204_11990, partial [Nitrospirae bacterium]|nr:hypothetical protein [Nitrospirota bacterium]
MIGSGWEGLRHWLWVVPMLLALGAHGNVLENGYGWDDETIIQNLRPADSWWEA